MDDETDKLVPEPIEESYKQSFPYLIMSPEEWVARNSHGVLCFGIHKKEYRDPRLKQWLVRVNECLHDRSLVLKLRQQYLTPAEQQEAIEIENNP